MLKMEALCLSNIEADIQTISSLTLEIVEVRLPSTISYSTISATYLKRISPVAYCETRLDF